LSTEFDLKGNIIVRGEYLEGKEEGFWLYEYGDHREEGEYKAGMRSGLWKHFYPDGKKAYYVNNQIIPAIFVEFVEGKKAFLIKPLTEEHNHGNYKLIYVFKKKYALVEDKNRSKFIVHFDNLAIDDR